MPLNMLRRFPWKPVQCQPGGQRGAMALLRAQGELPLSVICCPTHGSLSIRQRTLPVLDNPLICSAPGKGPQAPAPGYRSRGMEVGTGGQQGALTFGSECSGHRHQRARVSSPFISTRLPQGPPVPSAFPSTLTCSRPGRSSPLWMLCPLWMLFLTLKQHQRGPRGNLVQRPCSSAGSQPVPGLWRDDGLSARHQPVMTGTGHVRTAAPAPAEAGSA